MKYKLRKLFFSAVSCAGFLFLGSLSFAQADNFKSANYKLNLVDRAAIKTYCSLSVLFDKGCGMQNVTKNVDNTSSPSATSNIKNSTSSEIQSVGWGVGTQEDIESINRKLEEQNRKIEDLKNRPADTVIRNVEIVRYVESVESVEDDDYEQLRQFGLYNTVVSEGSRAFGDYNTITIDAAGSYVLGSDIVNTSEGSVEIGTSNYNKLHIGADGFVGIASKTGANISRVADEQLRVGGRVRAAGFDVDSAADVAENFPADEVAITAGDIVEFSTTTHKWQGYEISGVVRARNPSKMIGIVATNPGVLLGSDVKGVPVAFSGRVPVKVTEESGRVVKGDRVTLSSVYKGVGAKLTKEGQSVGVALSSDNGSGSVLVLVKSEYVTSSELTSTQ